MLRAVEESCEKDPGGVQIVHLAGLMERPILDAAAMAACIV